MLLPSVRDPRLHLAATIISLHVIGQVWLQFELSIAQILVAIGTAAVLEIGIVFAERRVIAWPASAMLTGNGVAFVLRVNGTRHGDWWSLHGWYIFAATAAIGLLSKYVVRWRDAPVFNPSNLALVVCFLILGTSWVNPLDFWWGPMAGPMIAVLAVLAAGALVVTRRVGMLGLALSCWATFAAGLAIPALLGHAMRARWSMAPVTDWTWWRIVVTSPEVIVFLFFMITDPKTTPASRRGRIRFGIATGAVAALLVAPARTEFWAKVGVLSALVVVHALWWAVRCWAPGARRGARLAGPRMLWAAVVLVAAIGVLSLGARQPLPGDYTLTGPVGSTGGPQAPLPPVTIDPGVAKVLGGLDQDQAQAMADGLGRHLAAQPIAYESLTVVIVRDPTNPQAIPRLGLRARSSTADVVYEVASGPAGYQVSATLTPAQAGLA